MDTLYEIFAKTFIESLKEFDIPYYVEAIDSLGSWYKNTHYKPTFIKKMLRKFPDVNIVYVDCDAVFFAYPNLFEELDCNIAIHLFDRTRYKKNRVTGFEILSGTIFLKNNEEIYELMERWEKECEKNPYVWDQRSLQKILGDNFYNLPPQYCEIFDMEDKVESPIIVHYQASRLVRKNKGKLTCDIRER